MKIENEFQDVPFAVELRKSGKLEWGIVLGSGLGILTDECRVLGETGYAEIPGLPVPAVPGHAGRFIFAEMLGHHVLIAQGRAHLYEGRTPGEVSAAVRFMAAAGVSKLILTNAAGVINSSFAPGSWMMIEDHLNLTGSSPLTGGPNFFDMSGIYSARLCDHFAKSAAWEKITLHRGIYAGVTGPQYETPAEVRMLRTLGADAVGMSTVLEAIQARALGVEVAGFSFLTNLAAGLGNQPLNHEEVLVAARTGAADFSRMLARALDTQEKLA